MRFSINPLIPKIAIAILKILYAPLLSPTATFPEIRPRYCIWNPYRRYCKKYGIRFHIYNYNPDNTKGNFQADARQTRYKNFGKICKKNNLDCVLVAHHKDDLIETYLMQVNKNMSVSYYGLASNVYLYYVFVNRPLLDYTKNDLIKYCEDNDIEYGIDESNNTDSYTRNKIRHSKVDKMSLSEKNKLVKKIQKINDREIKHLTKSVEKLSKKNDFELEEFLKIPYLTKGLRGYFGNKSERFYDEMIRQLKQSETYLYKGQGMWISKEYGMVHIFEQPKEYCFKYKNIDELIKAKTAHYKVLKKGNGREAVKLSKSDFPLTIRSYKDGDSISMNFGTKKVNRFFIDNKILISDRLTWPIVLNKKGNAILVPGLGCDIEHYAKKENVYVIKL